MGILTAFVAFCAASFAGSFLFALAARRLALRLGFLDHPAERKAHRAPIPLGGGLAVFLGTWAPIWLAVLAVAGLERGWWPQLAAWLSPEARALLRQHGPGVLAQAPRLAGLCGACLLLVGMGLWDDLRGMHPWGKIFGMTAAGLGLVAVGLRLSTFPGLPLAEGALTVCWVIVITNAFNLLDNMDGLCAGVGLVAAVLLAVIAAQTGQLFIVGVLACFCLALLGFLCLNFPPAALFLGDAGSHLVGFLLAALVVAQTFLPAGEAAHAPVFALVLPLLIMAVPLYDTASVLFLRLREGRPIYLGDRSHFSHRLLDLGLSPRETLLVILSVGLAAGLPAIFLARASAGQALVSFFQAAGVLALVALLERAGRRRR